MSANAPAQPAPSRLFRVLQFPLVRILVATIAVVGVIALVQGLSRLAHIAPHSPGGALTGVVLIAAVFATYTGYVRAIERRPVVELGRAGLAGEIALGALIGGALFALTMLALWLAGVVQVTAGGGWVALGFPLLGALIAAVGEEVIVRGILFRIAEQSLGTWIALGLSAGLFGALHALNPGATLFSSIAIALEAGIVLGAAFIFTRRLWLPIGLHAAWNFTEGGVFGADVSGRGSQGLLASHFQGPDILTGGAFGPEASIVAVLVCLTAAAVLLVAGHNQGRILSPVWRRRAPDASH